MKNTWLSDNIRSILAVCVLSGSFIVILILLLANVKASEVEKTTIIGTLANIDIVVLSYFFGSSKDKPTTSGKIENAKEVNINTDGK
jgi:hypothetical protein